MNALVTETCNAQCARATEAELEHYKAQLPQWLYDAEKREIFREFRFKNYYHVMSMVNAIAWIANKEGHHPDMEVSYNRILVRYTTHDSGGVTRNDAICAAKIDALLSVGNVGPVLV